MSWSNQQAHQIIEQFWRSGTASCPEDNGPLKLRLHKLHGGDYELIVECLYCGKSRELDARTIRSEVSSDSGH